MTKTMKITIGIDDETGESIVSSPNELVADIDLSGA